MKNEILLVEVLYNERLEDTKTYKSLIAKNLNLPLYVYDNSPISRFPKTGHDIYYVHDSQNPGLSYAYNRAAEYACEKGYSWILLLDQDTIFAEGVMGFYQKAIEENSDIFLFVPPMMIKSGLYMSPVRMRHRVARPAVNVPNGRVRFSEYTPINSGMMINVDAFIKVGGYNERVKLDFSDFQFIERFSKTYLEFMVLPIVCHQEFSNEIQNVKQKMVRYILFCECLKGCTKDTLIDHIDYFYVGIKRMLNLCVQTKSVKPFFIFLTKAL